MMNRRHFLRRAAVALPGLAFATKATAETFSTMTSPLPSFSLRLVTDQPAIAMERVGRFLRDAVGVKGRVQVAEQPLGGQHIGDVVFLQNGALLDFRQSQSPQALALQALARALQLPRTVERPVLLTFSTASERTPTHAHIFQGNLLIGQLALAIDQPQYVIAGSKGTVTLALEAGHVQIKEASCKHKTCMKMGAIHQAGEALVCIPNQIRVQLDGTAKRQFDAISQ